jgi:hypothetical protein
LNNQDLSLNVKDAAARCRIFLGCGSEKKLRYPWRGSMLANFKAALAARGMKQIDLALNLRIPSSTMSEIVNERRYADASTRERIASALRVEESWLFSRRVKIPEPAKLRES